MSAEQLTNMLSRLDALKVELASYCKPNVYARVTQQINSVRQQMLDAVAQVEIPAYEFPLLDDPFHEVGPLKPFVPSEPEGLKQLRDLQVLAKNPDLPVNFQAKQKMLSERDFQRYGVRKNPREVPEEDANEPALEFRDWAHDSLFLHWKAEAPLAPTESASAVPPEPAKEAETPPELRPTGIPFGRSQEGTWSDWFEQSQTDSAARPFHLDRSGPADSTKDIWRELMK